MIDIQNRIIEFKNIHPSEFDKHPKNWRKHPPAQKQELEAILEKIGYVGAVIARKTPTGYALIDGHLRAETTPDMPIPTLVTDLTEDEGDEVLVKYDPMGAMAGAKQEELRTLLDKVKVHTGEMQRYYDDVLSSPKEFNPNWAEMDTPSQYDIEQRAKELRRQFADKKLPDMIDVICPECAVDFQIRRSDFTDNTGRDS